MIPVDFKEANFTFTRPKSMTDEQCGDLRVWKGYDLAGFPIIVSCWRLSKEDLEEINRTGKIWLSVTSEVTPPVSLFTEYPFQNAKVTPQDY